MPVVTIQQSPGRTVEQRRLLVKRITEAFEEAYHVKPEDIMVMFQNYDDDQWGQGGLLHLDRTKIPGKGQPSGPRHHKK